MPGNFDLKIWVAWGVLGPVSSKLTDSDIVLNY